MDLQSTHCLNSSLFCWKSCLLAHSWPVLQFLPSGKGSWLHILGHPLFGGPGSFPQRGKSHSGFRSLLESAQASAIVTGIFWVPIFSWFPETWPVNVHTWICLLGACAKEMPTTMTLDNNRPALGGPRC